MSNCIYRVVAPVKEKAAERAAVVPLFSKRCKGPRVAQLILRPPTRLRGKLCDSTSVDVRLRDSRAAGRNLLRAAHRPPALFAQQAQSGRGAVSLFGPAHGSAGAHRRGDAPRV